MLPGGDGTSDLSPAGAQNRLLRVSRACQSSVALTKTGLVCVSIAGGSWSPLHPSGTLSRDQLSWDPRLSSAPPLPAASTFSVCCLGLDLWWTLCRGMAFPVTFIPWESPQAHPFPTHQMLFLQRLVLGSVGLRCSTLTWGSFALPEAQGSVHSLKMRLPAFLVRSNWSQLGNFTYLSYKYCLTPYLPHVSCLRMFNPVCVRQILNLLVCCKNRQSSPPCSHLLNTSCRAHWGSTNTAFV